MNVSGQFLDVGVCLDKDGFISPLEKVSDERMFFIEKDCIGSIDEVHDF